MSFCKRSKSFILQGFLLHYFILHEDAVLFSSSLLYPPVLFSFSLPYPLLWQPFFFSQQLCSFFLFFVGYNYTHFFSPPILVLRRWHYSCATRPPYQYKVSSCKVKQVSFQSLNIEVSLLTLLYMCKMNLTLAQENKVGRLLAFWHVNYVKQIIVSL